MSGGSEGATEQQIAALAKFPGVKMKQVEGEIGAYDVKGSEAVSGVQNVSMRAITFPACVFGLDDKSADIFDAIDALYPRHPLPASCRSMAPARSGQQSYCYVDGNLFSFTHYDDSGTYAFWMMDPVYWGPKAEAAGVKPP
jgi:hypothetical protein